MKSKQIELISHDCHQALKPNSLLNLKNQKITITGASGFVGSWLLHSIQYLNESHKFNIQVCAVIKKKSEFDLNKPHLSNFSWLKIISEDVRRITELPKDTNYVIHLAGTPDNRIHSSDPWQVADTIVNGTARILEISSLLPSLKKFLNLSSGLVYGRHGINVGKIAENSICNIDCSKISSTYAEAKRMSEVYTNIYRSQYRIPVVNLRPFAFIGPYQLLDRPWAINNFIRDAIKGGPIRILGDQQTIRSYMYPSDMAFWILNALANASDGTTFNLGSPEGRNLRQVAEEITRNFSNPISIHSAINSNGQEASCLVPDISYAKTNLGLDVSVSFEQAIKKTVEWFKLEN